MSGPSRWLAAPAGMASMTASPSAASALTSARRVGTRGEGIVVSLCKAIASPRGAGPVHAPAGIVRRTKVCRDRRGVESGPTCLYAPCGPLDHTPPVFELTRHVDTAIVGRAGFRLRTARALR